MRGHGPRGYAYPRAGARGVMWLRRLRKVSLLFLLRKFSLR
jgi:hypothetical protein